MNIEKNILGIIIAVVVLFISLLLYFVVDEGLYKTVESKIIVEQYYDSVENKRASVDKCIKLLETNGYVMHNAKTVSHGNKNYVLVKGIKYCDKKLNKE